MYSSFAADMETSIYKIYISTRKYIQVYKSGLYLSVCLSICLSIYLSIYISLDISRQIDRYRYIDNKMLLIIYWPCILLHHLRFNPNSLIEFNWYGASMRNGICLYQSNCFLRFLAWSLSHGTSSKWTNIWTESSI